MKKINLLLVYLVSFIYMEFFYKILVFDNIFRLSIINMILFLIPLSVLLSIITNMFKNQKINKAIFIIIMILTAVWFSAQYVVKGYFGFFVSWGAFKVADQVGDFASKGVMETLKR